MLRPYHGLLILLRAWSAWQTMGPALVLYHYAEGPARLSQWPLYVGALLAQFALDILMAAIRTRSLGMPLRSIVRPLAWTWCIDGVLATVGLSAVVATHGRVRDDPLPLGARRSDLAAGQRPPPAGRTLAQSWQGRHGGPQRSSAAGPADRVSPTATAWEEAIAAAQSEIDASWGTRIAAIAVADVDRLSEQGSANDTLGHSVGDALIAATASSLLHRQGSPAQLGRDGTEFGVLWVTTHEEYEAFDFVGTLTGAMTGSDALEHVSVLASIGSATTPPAASVEAALEVTRDGQLFAHKQRRLVT